MKAHLSSCLGVALACTIGQAAAVELGATGQGQALVFPYYNATGSNAALISVSHGALIDPRFDLSPGLDGKLVAVQVSVPLQDGGRKAFIVYLPDGATWTAAILTEQDGVSLVSADQSCTYPSLAGDTAGQVDLEGIAATGYVEVFALGELAYTEPLVRNALPSYPLYRDVDNTTGPSAPRDCSAIDAAWASGVWSENPANLFTPPRNTLSGSLQIVDLQRGVGLSTTTMALANFSDKVLHRNVASEAVDWGDVSPARSRVFTDEGPLESTWGQPVDAVTAVLTAEYTLEYWKDPGVALATDLVVTLPTRPLYGDTPGAPFRWEGSVRTDLRPVIAMGFVDRAGRPHGQIGPLRNKSTKCSPPVRSDERAPLDLPLMVLSSPVESSIDANATPLYDTAGHDGNCRIEYVVTLPDVLYGRAYASGVSDRLVSVEGHRFSGVPGIMTALTRSSDSFEGKSFGFQLPSSRHVRVLLPAE